MVATQARRRVRRLRAVGAAGAALVAGSLAAVAAAPAYAAECNSVDYAVTAEWSGAHNASVSITAGSDGIDDWTIEFNLPQGSAVRAAWNVDWEQVGSTFTGSDVGWNASIAPGQTREVFGMTVNGAAAAPTTFSINGQPCGGVGEPTVAPTTVRPTTVAPTTVAPTTVAPTTVAPTTAAPTSAPPQQAKQSRVPRFIIDAGAETGNFVESENFTVRWGNAVDVVAWGRQRGYDNYPQWVANHMEEIWDFYVNDIGWVDPADHNPGANYRINLYLCGSWSGDFLPTANWAGPDEIGVGHMCLPYDKTWDNWVESHEFNHILQSYASDINAANGNGGGWGHGNPVAGPVWEAHANYMARMKRPEVVVGSGYYVDRQHVRWLAQETYYGDWMLFNTIRDTYGPAGHQPVLVRGAAGRASDRHHQTRPRPGPPGVRPRSSATTRRARSCTTSRTGRPSAATCGAAAEHTGHCTPTPSRARVAASTGSRAATHRTSTGTTSSGSTRPADR